MALDHDAPPGSLQPPSVKVDRPVVSPLPEVPATRGQDHINVLVRDPESAFIYWELTPDGVARARSQLGGQGYGDQTLRIYITDDTQSGAGNSAPQIRDIPTKDWLGRYVVEPAQPGARIVAAIGFQVDGTFVHVAQSAPSRFPRRGPGSQKPVFSEVAPGGYLEWTEVDLAQMDGAALRQAAGGKGSNQDQPNPGQLDPDQPNPGKPGTMQTGAPVHLPGCDSAGVRR